MHRNLARTLWSPLLVAALALSLAPAAAHAACQLNSPTGKIKHVVYVEFDNVHFTRDNPNVPSDLEQMPNLLNFLENNGTLDAEQRDSLAAQMKSILEAAEFQGARIDTKQAQNLIAAAAELVAQAESAASSL